MNTPDVGAPPPQKATRESFDVQTSVRWMLVFFCSVAGFVILWAIYFDSAAHQMKSWLARSYIPKLQVSIEKEDWGNASTSLNQALRWAPKDPEVLRAAIDFVKRTGSEPRSMIRFLTPLDEIGQITSAERALLGSMYVQVPDLQAAHRIYDELPEETLRSRPTLELLAAIQKAEGLNARSFLTQRQALLADPEDPDSVLQLALLDARSGDASLSGPARERLWPIARSGGIHALPAIEYLSQHRQITAAEGLELLALVESIKDNPKVVATRFQVLSTNLRLNPHRRQELLNQEILRWNGKPAATLPPLLEWLVNERENERVFRLVSAKTAANYSSLLPFYVAALRDTKQWGNIKILLYGRIDSAFSGIQVRIWLAEAESHLSTDQTQPRQILSTVLEESGRGENAQAALRAAEMAEQLGFWDIAGRCYAGIAAKHPAQSINMNLKVYEMASRQQDGPAMLKAGIRLRDLKGTDVIFLDRVNYLRLLLGTDLEIANQDLDQIAAQPKHHITQDRQIAIALLRALAAYRSGQLDLISKYLADVKQVDTFPPGPRAVYAGLLAITGDTAGAYKFAEKVPSVLLLPEERRFLSRAW